MTYIQLMITYELSKPIWFRRILVIQLMITYEHMNAFISKPICLLYYSLFFSCY